MIFIDELEEAVKYKCRAHVRSIHDSSLIEVMEYAQTEGNELYALKRRCHSTNFGTTMGLRAKAMSITSGTDYGLNLLNHFSQELNSS